ncbi:MAG: translation initiation factor IF-1 [Candidatus Peribacteria bacterium]|jgi:translation initiation factor IF-1|nr:translation initiation factor IF-1 [Candidatus Peribacteria bacterium]
MAKAGVLERDGEIMEVLPAGNFRVKLKDVEMIVMAKMSGKMRQAHISVIVGDWVKVEVSQYDMKQGRIVYRYNPNAVKAMEETPVA